MSETGLSFEKLTFMAGLMMPVMTIPQAYAIWINHQTQGVSAITWLMYTVISLLFVVYGVRQRERLLVITYLPMFGIEVLIVAGLLFK